MQISHCPCVAWILSASKASKQCWHPHTVLIQKGLFLSLMLSVVTSTHVASASHTNTMWSSSHWEWLVGFYKDDKNIWLDIKYSKLLQLAFRLISKRLIWLLIYKKAKLIWALWKMLQLINVLFIFIKLFTNEINCPVNVLPVFTAEAGTGQYAVPTMKSGVSKALVLNLNRNQWSVEWCRICQSTLHDALPHRKLQHCLPMLHAHTLSKNES